MSWMKKAEPVKFDFRDDGTLSNLWRKSTSSNKQQDSTNLWWHILCMYILDCPRTYQWSGLITTPWIYPDLKEGRIGFHAAASREKKDILDAEDTMFKYFRGRMATAEVKTGWVLITAGPGAKLWSYSTSSKGPSEVFPGVLQAVFPRSNERGSCSSYIDLKLHQAEFGRVFTLVKTRMTPDVRWLQKLSTGELADLVVDKEVAREVRDLVSVASLTRKFRCTMADDSSVTIVLARACWKAAVVWDDGELKSCWSASEPTLGRPDRPRYWTWSLPEREDEI